MASNYANQFDADMKANLAIARTISTTMESYETEDRDEVILILKTCSVIILIFSGLMWLLSPMHLTGKMLNT
jgi:hypothetical protein